MPIKPELKEWMDRLPLSENVKAILTPELEKEDVQNKFFETMVPRSEYSRTLNAKDTEAKQLVENERKIALTAKQSYDTFKENEQKKVDKFYADNNAALLAEQKQRKAYEARLGDLVSQGLITPEEATVAKAEFTPLTAVIPPAPDRKYVTEDKLANAVEMTQTQYVHAIAKINDIADVHFDLFGTRLNRAELVQATLDAGGKKKVEEVWAEKYGVAAKQAELQKANEEARIKAAVDEAVVRDRSERAIAGDNAPYTGLDDGANKHILSMFPTKDGASRGMGVSSTVAKAAEAYRQRQAAGGSSTVGAKSG